VHITFAVSSCSAGCFVFVSCCKGNTDFVREGKKEGEVRYSNRIDVHMDAGTGCCL